jgi:hypothetical protein
MHSNKSRVVKSYEKTRIKGCLSSCLWFKKMGEGLVDIQKLPTFVTVVVG